MLKASSSFAQRVPRSQGVQRRQGRRCSCTSPLTWDDYNKTMHGLLQSCRHPQPKGLHYRGAALQNSNEMLTQPKMSRASAAPQPIHRQKTYQSSTATHTHTHANGQLKGVISSSRALQQLKRRSHKSWVRAEIVAHKGCRRKTATCLD